MDQNTSTLPSHVDPALVRDYDMFNISAVDGEYQLGVTRFMSSLNADIPRVFWTERNGGHWVFNRGEDITYAIEHPELFSANKMFVPREKNPNPPLIPLMLDPPEQPKYRALLTPAFTPRAVSVLADKARALAIKLVEGFKPRGECEFVKEFAEVLPIAIFMSMVDLPESDREMLLEIGEQHVRPITPQHHIDSMRDLQAYTLQKIKERRGSGGTDLITQLTEATVDGQKLDDHTLTGIIVLLLVAGLDTVAAGLGWFALFLARNPEHRKRLVENPELIPHACEEIMRRYSIATVGRILTQDMTYQGVTMKAGDMLIMPTLFLSVDRPDGERPLEVDFDRKDVTHGAFSLGAHRCIGSMLARVEMRIFVEEWLKRIPEFEVKPGTDLRISTGTVSGLRGLPLVWKTA